MFVLLKVLLFFLRPLFWIVVLFCLSFFISHQKRRNRLFKTALLLLLFFSNPFIIRSILRGYEWQPVTIPPGSTYHTAIVLGGFVSYNRKEDKAYFNEAGDRFIQTALLYKTGKIRHILVAAGNGYMVQHNFTEASFIKERLFQLGIPDTAILVDGLSRNTLENAINAKKILDAARFPGPFLLVSSAMHLPRARLAFEKLGVHVVPYPCDFSSKAVGNNLLEDYLLPSAVALNKWDNLLKEIAGILVYRVRG